MKFDNIKKFLGKFQKTVQKLWKGPRGNYREKKKRFYKRYNIWR